MAVYRRYIQKHPRAVKSDFYDWFILLGLFLAGFQGLFTEALRIVATDFPSWETFSFAGYFMAIILSFFNLDLATLQSIHFVSWWVHAFTAQFGIALILYTKLGHLGFAPLNMLFKENKPIGKVSINPENSIKTVKDFTVGQIISLEACMKCARCHVVCPAQASGEPLSPMMVIQDSKAIIRADFPLLSFYKKKQNYSTIPGGSKVTADVLWACTNCMACVDACPVWIHHVDIITSMRGALIEEGKDVPAPITAMLESVYQNKNEYGQPKKERTKWAKDLPFEVPEVKKNNAELLWWVGSTSSYDPRNQKVAKAFAKILNATGTVYGTLGDKEGNTGDAVRRVGEEALFRELAESNIKAFEKAGIKKIVTTSPHSFNAIKNEYPEIGFDSTKIEVIHHTQLIWELIQSGKIEFQKPIKKTITFHDACYMGRYNNIIDIPRKILKAIPGIELLEMPRSGKESFCCGGGGGRAFMPSHTEIKPSEIRVQEAKTTLQSAESSVSKSIIVECHWCVQMLTDAVKTQNIDQEIAVDEIAELVAEAMGLT
jgi:Fe-S oxidoreductase